MILIAWVTWVALGLFIVLQMLDWYTTYQFYTHPQLGLVEDNNLQAAILETLTKYLGEKWAALIGTGTFKVGAAILFLIFWGFVLPATHPIVCFLMLISAGYYVYVVLHNVSDIQTGLKRLGLTWADLHRKIQGFGV